MRGAVSDDANNDVHLVGARGQRYGAFFYQIARYTNFTNGAFRLRPGQKVTGAVTFVIPDGVKITAVRWTADSGFGTTVVWKRHRAR